MWAGRLQNYLPWVCELRDGDSPCDSCGVRVWWGDGLKRLGSFGQHRDDPQSTIQKACWNGRYYIQVSFAAMATASRQNVHWFYAFWRCLARPGPDQLSICAFPLLPIVRTHPGRYRPPDRPCTSPAPRGLPDCTPSSPKAPPSLSSLPLSDLRQDLSRSDFCGFSGRRRPPPRHVTRTSFHVNPMCPHPMSPPKRPRHQPLAPTDCSLEPGHLPLNPSAPALQTSLFPSNPPPPPFHNTDQDPHRSG